MRGSVPQGKPLASKPLAIDLYCGLGGWAEGFLAEGYDVVGFDIERHDYGTGGYPGQLVLQDVTTLHGRQFRDAAVIVASPPCQAYSYRAMPWKRAKALPPPSNDLFDACFRIQREASEAAGRHVPLIVENVRGAQPWVGRAAWHFGSYYLWGDVPALMPQVLKSAKKTDCSPVPVGKLFNETGERVSRIITGHLEGRNLRAQKHNPDGTNHGPGSWPTETGANPVNGTKGFVTGLGRAGTIGVRTIKSSAHKSKARKAASAQIAKIPFPLAQHIARVFNPDGQGV